MHIFETEKHHSMHFHSIHVYYMKQRINKPSLHLIRTKNFIHECSTYMYINKLIFFLLQDGDKSAKKKAAAASLGGQQEMTPEQLQAEEEVFY